MRFFLVFGCALSLSVSAAGASAQEASPSPRRFEVGLSSGYSVAGFKHLIADFDSLWAIPLTVDLDYRFAKHWSGGVYGELGFIDDSAPDVEDVDETIVGQHYRLGAEVLYHSALERHVQPWFGVGLGYDALRATYRARGTLLPQGGNETPEAPGVSIRASGFEVGHVQLGIDFAFVPALSFGPFLGASVVAYGRRRGALSSDDVNVWSNIGLKAALHL